MTKQKQLDKEIYSIVWCYTCDESVRLEYHSSDHDMKGRGFGGKQMTFNEILDQLRSLHQSKSHDYSDGSDPYSNYTAASKAIGISSYQYVCARIAEKQHRLECLMSKEASPKHESVLETHKDIAAMSIIAMELLDE